MEIEIYNKITKYKMYIYTFNKYIRKQYKYEIYNQNKTWYNMNIKHSKNFDFCNISATSKPLLLIMETKYKSRFAEDFWFFYLFLILVHV